jgi:hypothetical protein
MFTNDVHDGASVTENCRKAKPYRRLRLALAVVVCAVAASVAMIPSQPSAASAATPQVWTITVSGDCAGGAATSDWQTVFGVDPTLTGVNTNPLYTFTVNTMQPGDTLKVVNKCSVGTLYLSKPWYLSFVGTPVFSSGAWNEQSSEGAIANQGHGQAVLGTTIQGEMSFSDIVKFGDPTDIWNVRSAIVTSPWNYGPFIFDEAELSTNGVKRDSFALALNQAATPIAIGTTPSYANNGDIEVRAGNYFPLSGPAEVSALPPGLNFACTVPIVEQSVRIGCTLPATIEGTPTQTGSYTVNLVFNNNAWGKITRSVTFMVAPTPTVSAVSPTSGSAAGGTTISVTGTNFAAGATVTVGGATCTNVTVVSAGSITCTTPAGSAGTASVVVSSGGQSSATNTLFTYTAVPITTTTSTPAPAPTPTTVEPATTVVSTVSASSPTLVTSANQAALTASPGKASVLVNGVAVTPQIVTASNSAAAQADPAERTPEQVRELQQAAATIETRLDTIAGGDSGVSVVRTETGAVMTGIFSGTRVPVEDVVVVNAADTATLFAARDVRGNIVEVKPGAVLEVASNGDVAVQAFGLRPGETVELVVMSTPTLLGSFTVDAKGAIKTSAKLPTSIGSGNHSLVVASPSVKASLGLKLVKSSASLPVTGSNTNTASNWAVAVLLSGMYLVLVSRSRRRVL